MPQGFVPLSVTFVSPEEGFVLGSVPCASGTCPSIAHTLDAGRSWSLLPDAPSTSLADPSMPVGEATAGISRLRFADPMDGWAYGPEVWATHDGGATWQHVTGAVPAGSSVVALEAAAGRVHAVAFGGFGGSAPGFHIVSAGVTSDTWQDASVTLPVGAGPVPSIQLVLSGDAGWILQNDRTVVNGARLVKGTWQSWQPVCAGVAGPAFIAASSATDLVAVCDVGVWSTPAGTQLYATGSGGATPAERAPGAALVPVEGTSAIASPNGQTVVVAGATSGGQALVASFDGGATWRQVLSLTGQNPVDLGFTTNSQGVVIGTGSAGTGTLFMTRDGGRTWTPVAF